MNRNFKYLLPITASQGSFNAKKYAFQFFSESDSEGYVLHVLENDETVYSVKEIFELAEDSEVVIKPKLSEVICEGEVVEKILTHASSVDPDLVIISSMGRNKENRFFCSKRATELVINSMYPVLMIPPDVTYNPIHNIIVATDLRTNNIQMIHHILRLFRKFNPSIHLLVLPLEKPGWQFKEEVQGLITSLRNYWNYEKIFVTLLESENILIRLEMFLKEQCADVLAFDKNNPRFQKIFFQNPDKQMPCCTDLPILTFPG